MEFKTMSQDEVKYHIDTLLVGVEVFRNILPDFSGRMLQIVAHVVARLEDDNEVCQYMDMVVELYLRQSPTGALGFLESLDFDIFNSKYRSWSHSVRMISGLIPSFLKKKQNPLELKEIPLMLTRRHASITSVASTEIKRFFEEMHASLEIGEHLDCFLQGIKPNVPGLMFPTLYETVSILADQTEEKGNTSPERVS
jgi:hypothetical protein